MGASYPPGWARRAYMLLLRIYPRATRKRFGQEMFDVFRNSWIAKREAGERAVAVRMWARALRDVTVNGVAVRFRRTYPHRPASTSSTLRTLLVTVRQDTRWGLRAMHRNPGFAAVVIATFALAVGVNTAVFSIVDGVLFRPLPFPESGRLIRVWSADTLGVERFQRSTFAEVTGIGERNRSFSGLAAYSMVPSRMLDGYSTPETVVLVRLTGDLPAVLGAVPIAGRTFHPTDFQGDGRVVMLSQGLWQRRYGGDPQIIGEQVSIRDEMLTVIGILPETFEYPQDAEAWRPFPVDAYQDDDRELVIVARLADGISVAQSTSDVRLITSGMRTEGADVDEVQSAWVQPLRATLVRDVRTALLLLLASVGLILLIGCVNVANLFLTRTSHRASELAIRTALGASRGRLVRHLVSEGLVLAFFGATVGLFVGRALLTVVLRLAPASTPRLSEVSLNSLVVAIMFGTVLITGVLVSALPGWRWSRLAAGSINVGTRSAVGVSRGVSAHRGLVAAEVALSTVLVAVAATLAGSFYNLLSFDRGFETESLLAVPISIADDHGSVQETRLLYARALELTRALPGVVSAALSFRSPLQTTSFRLSYRMTAAVGDGSTSVNPYLHSVSPGYFSTVKVSLSQGRAFSIADDVNARAVGVINDTFARQYFGVTDPVGHVLYGENGDEIEIIGVVGDIRPTAASVPALVLYRPFAQLVIPFNYLLVRTVTNPLDLVPTIRERIWSLNPNIALDEIATIDQEVSGTLAAPRFNMLFASFFACIALVLAMIGVYGVMSYTVASRRPEWGLRQVLGADRMTVLRHVLLDSLRVTASGVGIGLILSVAVRRAIRSVLYDVAPGELVVLVSVFAVLAGVAIGAALIPAIRATGVTPLAAFRD